MWYHKSGILTIEYDDNGDPQMTAIYQGAYDRAEAALSEEAA